MTICHSFWSRPCNESRLDIDSQLQWKVNIYCFMLSCLWVKKHGCRVVFYGDKESIRRFRCIPYDEFVEISIPEDANPLFWAQGKFYAYQKMNLGDIHIDGDVFMRGDKIYDILRSDYDCVVQAQEDQKSATTSGYVLARNILKDVHWTDGCTSSLSPSYNVGVCGIKNQELKDRYIHHYFDSIKTLHHLKPQKDFIPDLIIEQQHLYEMSQDFKVATVLGETSRRMISDNKKMYQDALDLGYQHVLSIYKYKEFPMIRKDLERLDPARCKILDILTKHIVI